MWQLHVFKCEVKSSGKVVWMFLGSQQLHDSAAPLVDFSLFGHCSFLSNHSNNDFSALQATYKDLAAIVWPTINGNEPTNYTPVWLLCSIILIHLMYLQAIIASARLDKVDEFVIICKELEVKT